MQISSSKTGRCISSTGDSERLWLPAASGLPSFCFQSVFHLIILFCSVPCVFFSFFWSYSLKKFQYDCFLLSWLIEFLSQGEKECSYFVKTGQCKFGVTCKFNHPLPAGAQVPAPAAGPGSGPGPLTAPAAVPAPHIYPPAVQSPSVQSAQQYGVVSGNWPVARPTLLPGSYIPGTYGSMLLPPGMVPLPGWTPYPVGTSYMLLSSVYVYNFSGCTDYLLSFDYAV